MSKEATLNHVGRKLFFNTITAEELSVIQDATSELLWETGILVESEVAADRFRAAGAKVEKKSGEFLVKLPEWLITESLASVPSNFPFYGQSQEFDFHPATDDPTILSYGVHVNIIDPNSLQVRATTKKDAENLSRLLNHLPKFRVQLDSIGAIDYPSGAVAAAQAHSMLSNNPRFIFCSSATTDENEVILKMCHAVAGGEDNFKERPFMCITASPISPLMMKNSCTNTLAFTAENGMVSHAVNMCLAGATGPVTLAGSVVLSVAELLGALVYVQIVKKGTPTLLSTCSSIMDMRSGLAASGSPDTSLICTISAKILNHYGLHGLASSGVSDAKLPDAQSAYEFTTNAALMAATHSSIVFGAGSLEGGLTFDYAKLLLDHESYVNILKFLDGLDFSRESLALDLMKEVGPGNTYLQHRSTFQKFRKTLSQNDLFSRTSREAWVKDGGKTVTERAYERVLELLSKPPATPLNVSIQEEIDTLLSDQLHKVRP
ncbi:MAG: trimethylamine methyltransferase family protein [Deltaproteobacteria bacterium]|nr:trimethylamine methyltransferase family protein [Deltaproteobacteria bacterium]